MEITIRSTEQGFIKAQQNGSLFCKVAVSKGQRMTEGWGERVTKPAEHNWRLSRVSRVKLHSALSVADNWFTQIKAVFIRNIIWEVYLLSLYTK